MLPIPRKITVFNHCNFINTNLNSGHEEMYDNFIKAKIANRLSYIAAFAVYTWITFVRNNNKTCNLKLSGNRFHKFYAPITRAAYRECKWIKSDYLLWSSTRELHENYSRKIFSLVSNYYYQQERTLVCFQNTSLLIVF